MSNPATPNIPLRCGPTGPEFDLQAALDALNINGSVCRVWSVPALPAEDVAVAGDGNAVLAQTIVVPISAAQEGTPGHRRCYLVWWHLLLEPEVDAQDLEEQPGVALGIVQAGAGDATQQSLALGVKLQRRWDSDGSGLNVFPWLADGDGCVLIVPGTTCPAFVVGNNNIKLLAAMTTVAGRIDALRSCLMVAELNLSATDAVRVAPSEPAP